VPPFVPARILAQQRFLRADDGGYERSVSLMALHVKQSSEDNFRRLMSTVCPQAAVFWWSGSSLHNRRGCVMAYLPTPSGHTGWYADFRYTDRWSVAGTVHTSARELSDYAADVQAASYV
jgi:hypothetical protein